MSVLDALEDFDVALATHGIRRPALEITLAPGDFEAFVKATGPRVVWTSQGVFELYLGATGGRLRVALERA